MWELGHLCKFWEPQRPPLGKRAAPSDPPTRVAGLGPRVGRWPTVIPQRSAHRVPAVSCGPRPLRRCQCVRRGPEEGGRKVQRAIVHPREEVEGAGAVSELPSEILPGGKRVLPPSRGGRADSARCPCCVPLGLCQPLCARGGSLEAVAKDKLTQVAQGGAASSGARHR